MAERANCLLQTLSDKWRSLFGTFHFDDVMVEDFMKWSSQGPIYVGSDGSVIGERGAHSFVWTSGVCETTIWGGAATSPGNPLEMSSQRAEHAGSIAALLAVHILHQVTEVEVVAVIWVDNAEVV